MYSKTTQSLKQYLKRKGVLLSKEYSRQFSKYDYFQVVNGYKGLFISSVETIDDIFHNIDQGLGLDRC